MTKLWSIVTATFVIGLVSAHGSSAQRQTPPTQAPAAAPQTAAVNETSPEEVRKRKDWNQSMLKKEAPKKGCFNATYPKAEWQEQPCVAAPNIPMPPRRGPRPLVVGSGNDIAAGAPSGFITEAIGHFDKVTNVKSESGPIGNSGAAVNNAYTLQINTDFFASTVCAKSPNPNCRGWEQFVFWNDGGAASAFIQYWLITYNATCPAGQNWNQFSFTGSTDIYCWKNNTGGGAVAVPNQPITNMGNWTFRGAATATADSVTMVTGGNNMYMRVGDNAVDAAHGWKTAEFNIFGAGGNSAGGGMASFNPGASVVTRTEIIYGGNAAPSCLAAGFTAETNNLTFGPTPPAATAPGPAVIFSESTAGGATSNCAAAATIGDTHLRTFNGLFYDFQATGDFVLAEVDPGFTVQTRQVSGAPTWPDASVNQAVAARFGKTQVAICLAPPGRDQRPSIHVDGKLTNVDDGGTLSLPDGVAIHRQGNLYQLTSEAGDSVRATVNPTWIDVNVGLGSWPSTVHGLMANANGNLDQLETRDHSVLRNPFNFDEFYHRFADSWRVPAGDSMLSVCNVGRQVERGAPRRSFLAKDLEAGVRDKARGVCAAAGVKDGPLLDACTLDVAVIGNDAAANVFLDVIPPAAVATIVGGDANAMPGGGLWWLWLLLILLALIVIAWLVIRKKKP